MQLAWRIQLDKYYAEWLTKNSVIKSTAMHMFEYVCRSKTASEEMPLPTFELVDIKYWSKERVYFCE